MGVREAGAGAQSVSKFYFGSLEMDTSDEKPRKFSGSSSDEPKLDSLSGPHKNTDRGNTEAAQRDHQTDQQTLTRSSV